MANDFPIPDIDRGTLESLLGHNFRRAYLKVLEHVVPRISAHGLSGPSFGVLSLVLQNPGLTSGQVGRTLGIRSSNMVPVVASLKEQGLIELRPHPTDRRMQVIHPTRASRSLAARAQRDIEEAEREATANLSDAEREQLVELLRRIHS